MATSPTLTTEEILLQLQKLTQGLYYQSEADYPLQVIQLDVTPTNDLTKETILNLTGKTPREPIEEMQSAFFFRHLTQVNPTSEKEGNLVTSSQALQTFLEQNLQNIKVYRIGRRTLLGLLIGKTSSGNWMGVKTTIIET